MNLTRKLKISKISEISFTEKEKEIIDFIDSWLKDLIPFVWDVKPESIYYMNSNGLYVLEQNNKTDILWIRYIDLWEVLRDIYLMKYDDIQILMKYLVEQAFKQKVSTHLKTTVGTYMVIEQAFKQKVSTP